VPPLRGLSLFLLPFPALTHWANFFRASGAGVSRSHSRVLFLK
jgi:hypothetical protein